MKFWGIFTFFLSFLAANATETMPWYGRSFEFETRLQASTQHFDKIAKNGGSFAYSSTPFFLNLSLANSYAQWAAEVETVFSATRSHNFNLDHARVTGRYLWQNDIVGDRFSLTSGVSLIFPLKVGLKDINSFHHGLYESLLHLAIGKEYAKGSDWSMRFWTVFGLGVANQGSPWLSQEFHLERQGCQREIIGISLKNLYGLGKRALKVPHDFNGYGAIAHRSIDVAAYYAWEFLDYSRFAFEYLYRIFAYNFPKGVHQVKLEFFYPFGL